MVPDAFRHADWARWLPAVALLAILGLLVGAARDPLARHRGGTAAEPRGPLPAAAAIDHALAERWRAAGVDPAPPVDELTILRRGWLALAGTIPSLEEIRAYEADPAPDRLERAIGRLLAERRSADWLARGWRRRWWATTAGSSSSSAAIASPTGSPGRSMPAAPGTRSCARWSPPAGCGPTPRP